VSLSRLILHLILYTVCCVYNNAQLAVFKRTFTAAEAEALSGKELAAYSKKKSKFLRKYVAIREQRRKQEAKAAKAAAAASSPKKHWWSKP
jgi:hypothetical protein